MEIVEVDGPEDTASVRLFLAVAREVYRHDPVWVPQSDDLFLAHYAEAMGADKKRFQAVVAVVDGAPLARAVAILLDRRADDGAVEMEGWIAFFEALPEQEEAAVDVLRQCESFLRRNGAASILAPKADNQLLGLQTGGFSLPQTVFTNHNPPYYLSYFEAAGYEVMARTLTYYFRRDTARYLPVRIPGIRTRTLIMEHLDRELEVFNYLQNAVFTNRRGRHRRTIEEDRAMFHSCRSFLDPDLIVIAEDAEGDPLGVLICLPDVYQVHKGEALDRARVVSIGALPGWRGRGAGVAMASHLMRNLLDKGYQTVEASWILADNRPPQNLARRFQAAPGREFVLLRRGIT